MKVSQLWSSWEFIRYICVLSQALAHTMEDSSKEKAGVLKHTLGFQGHPEKRECSHQRTEVVKGNLALLELTKTCNFTQAGLSCLWALWGQLLSQDPHGTCLGDPSSCLCLRYFLDTAPGPDSKAGALKLSPALHLYGSGPFFRGLWSPCPQLLTLVLWVTYSREPITPSPKIINLPLAPIFKETMRK